MRSAESLADGLFTDGLFEVFTPSALQSVAVRWLQ